MNSLNNWIKVSKMGNKKNLKNPPHFCKILGYSFGRNFGRIFGQLGRNFGFGRNWFWPFRSFTSNRIELLRRFTNWWHLQPKIHTYVNVTSNSKLPIFVTSIIHRKCPEIENCLDTLPKIIKKNCNENQVCFCNPNFACDENSLIWKVLQNKN